MDCQKTKDVYKGENISIYSEDMSDLKLGFEEYQSGKYRKVLRKSELETVYRVMTCARYQGHRFVIASGNSEEVLLTPVGWNDPSFTVLKNLDFDEVERAVFEKTVPADELEHVWYEVKPLKGFPAPTATVIELPKQQ